MLDWTFETQEADIARVRRMAVERVDGLLRPLGTSSARIEPLAGSGVNNAVYSVETQTGAILILRVTNPHALLAGHKTRSEVQAMAVCRAATKLPVPEVYGYATDAEEHGFEYILMERLPGVPLSKIWPKLDARARLDWAIRVAAMIAELDAVVLPHLDAPARLGGFSTDLAPGVSRGDHPPLGPFATVAERLSSELRWAADSIRPVSLRSKARLESHLLRDLKAARRESS